MKYKCCLFDLDGTLVNSLRSLTYCTNLALSRFGLGPITVEQMKTIAGDGYRMQMRRSLLQAGDKELIHYEEILPVYMEIFSKNCTYELYAYDGILEFLQGLKERGLKIGVVSNKPHAQVVYTVDRVFGEGFFDVVLGESQEIPKKPDPKGALTAAGRLGAAPDECLYFGDTNTDMQTGINAGMTTIGVLWGFRDRAELEKFHPACLIETPKEMLEILDRM